MVEKLYFLKNSSFTGLRRNKYGPINAYRVLVIDETIPSPFMLNSTYDYKKAKAYGLNYWIAAEFDESYMGRDAKNIEFVVGDNKTYGGYLNFGPLPPKRDFHVSLGVVSTLNQVTKVSYAKGEFFSKVKHLSYFVHI